MLIKTFTSGPVETNCYLVGCPETHEAAIIDAPKGVLSKIIHETELKIKIMFITITRSGQTHIKPYLTA